MHYFLFVSCCATDILLHSYNPINFVFNEKILKFVHTSYDFNSFCIFYYLLVNWLIDRLLINIIFNLHYRIPCLKILISIKRIFFIERVRYKIAYSFILDLYFRLLFLSLYLIPRPLKIVFTTYQISLFYQFAFITFHF